MKAFINDYGMFIAGIVIAIMLASVLFTFTYKNETLANAVAKPGYFSAGNNASLAAKEKPTLIVVNGVVFTGTGDFNAKDYIVKAEDAEGNDLIDSVTIKGDDFDTNVPGDYTIKYSVKDSNHLISKAQAIIRVEDEPEVSEEDIE